jgi:hypothetical protein
MVDDKQQDSKGKVRRHRRVFRSSANQRRSEHSQEALSRDSSSNRRLGLTRTQWEAVALTAIVFFVMNPPVTTQSGPQGQGELVGQFIGLVVTAFLFVWIPVYVIRRVRE